MVSGEKLTYSPIEHLKYKIIVAITRILTRERERERGRRGRREGGDGGKGKGGERAR